MTDTSVLEKKAGNGEAQLQTKMNHSIQTPQTKDLLVPCEYARESHLRKSLCCSLSSITWTDWPKMIATFSECLPVSDGLHKVFYGRAQSKIRFKLFFLSEKNSQQFLSLSTERIQKQVCGWSCANPFRFLPSPAPLNDENSIHESKF